MPEKEIAFIISQAIIQGKWLYLGYLNQKKEEHYFFFAVKDIDFSRKILQGDMFNTRDGDGILYNRKIFFNAIFHCRYIYELSYQVPERLIKKLEELDKQDDFLGILLSKNNVFLYLEQCLQLNKSEEQKSGIMLAGIDMDTFSANKSVKLNLEQSKNLCRYLLDKDKETKNLHQQKIIHLIFNVLSITSGNKNTVIVYQEVFFNIEKQELSINPEFLFNRNFLIETIDKAGADNFVKNFQDKKEAYIYRLEQIIGRYRKINTRPEFMEIEFSFFLKFNEVRASIQNMIENNALTMPLKAYLGIKTRRGGAKRNTTLITYDNKINIDQLRCVFNALREDVTYCAGPPGTGKTQTILNIIFSQFFNEKTCLICSNNNKALEAIMEKFTSLKTAKRDLFLPIFRVGNQSELEKSIIYLKNIYQEIKDKPKLSSKEIKKRQYFVMKKCYEISEIIDKYEEKLQISEELQNLIIWQETNAENNQLNEYFKSKIAELQAKKDAINDISDSELLKLCFPAIESQEFLEYIQYRSYLMLEKLTSQDYVDFLEILETNLLDTARKKLVAYLKKDENIQKLQKIFPIWITTNFSAEKIGSANPHFDLCLMDEAGQCDIASSLIPIIRAKRLLLVGDTEQLRPIINLERRQMLKIAKNLEFDSPDLYDFTRESVLSLMTKTDKNSKQVLLSYHYRCPEEIIAFSNLHYYDNQLKYNAGQEGAVEIVQVANQYGPERNCFYEEAEGVAELCSEDRFLGEQVAVISPFRNQAALIDERLKNRGITNVSVGTIHSVQGSEYDTVILSPSVAKSTAASTFNWIKNNSEIINVAATRAKRNFVICCDVDAINELSDKYSAKIIDKEGIPNTEVENNKLKSLVDYALANNKSEVIKVLTEYRNKNKSNNSSSEREFYKTVSQVLSNSENLSVKRNVAMNKLFVTFEEKNKEYYENAEFDFVIFDNKRPVLIIELDGDEHYQDQATKYRDKRKELICKAEGCKILRISNQYSLHYELIKKVVMDMAKNKNA